MMFRESSWKLLMPLIITFIVVNTVCLRILERCASAARRALRGRCP